MGRALTSLLQSREAISERTKAALAAAKARGDGDQPHAARQQSSAGDCGSLSEQASDRLKVCAAVGSIGISRYRVVFFQRFVLEAAVELNSKYGAVLIIEAASHES